MKSHLLLVAAMLAASVATSIGSLAQERPMQTMTMRAHPLPIEGTLPSLAGATTWLNSQPLTPEALRGKVVVVDFWTYTCINWQRTEPYVRAWAEKYKDQGLVVIGVHTPEFGFEKNVDNIRPALKMFRIEYPVAVDSDYAIWQAFSNRYWPAVYVVDANGKIRHHQFGEGEYERTEAVIQQLLREAGYSGMGNDVVQVDARGSEVAADWDNLRSQENYLGRDKAEGFVSPGKPVLGKTGNYVAPRSLGLNEWALSGDWTLNAGAVALDKANGRVVYRFHARDFASGHGTAISRIVDTFPRSARRAPAGECSRHRRRRARLRHGQGTAALPAHPAAPAHCGSTVRDRIPRPRRRGLCLHVRVKRVQADAPNSFCGKLCALRAAFTYSPHKPG